MNTVDTLDTMVGRKVGNFLVTRKIGGGAWSTVYEAQHPVLARRVALKVLHDSLCQESDAVERFFDEARIVSAIGHPNIVEIYDLGQTEPGRHYLMLELLTGENLGARIRRLGPLDLYSAVDIASQVADAMQAVHARGVVHRDLKPDNIILTDDEGFERAKVLDFGIAKLTDSAVRTMVGTTMGTPNYMAPEQCDGSPEIDGRADVYSLGIVLYRMVTGAVPFRGKSVEEIMNMHMEAMPKRPRMLRPDLPHELEDTIMRALAKLPENRFASMERFRHALGECPLGGSQSITPDWNDDDTVVSEHDESRSAMTILRPLASQSQVLTLTVRKGKKSA